LRARASRSFTRWSFFMWHELLLALALLFVIEGIIPFLAPGLLRRMLLEAARQDDRSLRLTGLASMIAGVAFLYLIN
jgi:uncharacterized protein YjeT (DUF2065 family)